MNFKKFWLPAAALVFSGSVLALQPTGALKFDEPTGTVTGDQAIPIQLTLTLDADSAALDYTSNPLTGLDLGTAPTGGYYFDFSDSTWKYADIVTFTGAYLSTAFGCSDTFTNGCTQSPYAFNFAASGDSALVFPDTFHLQPGDSFSFLYGEFDPVGTASVGTYSLINASVVLNYEGFDASGNFLTSSVTIASTCSDGDPNCSFQRSVVDGVLAVPEPGLLAMIGGGALMLLGLAHRRRRSR